MMVSRVLSAREWNRETAESRYWVASIIGIRRLYRRETIYHAMCGRKKWPSQTAFHGFVRSWQRLTSSTASP